MSQQCTVHAASHWVRNLCSHVDEFVDSSEDEECDEEAPIPNVMQRETHSFGDVDLTRSSN
jgi:hypothetical protein